MIAELHIADIRPQPQPCAHPDRDQHLVAAAKIADVEPAQKIGRALARDVAFVEIFGVVKIVDQNEGAAGIRARCEAAAAAR